MFHSPEFTFPYVDIIFYMQRDQVSDFTHKFLFFSEEIQFGPDWRKSKEEYCH